MKVEFLADVPEEDREEVVAAYGAIEQAMVKLNRAHALKPLLYALGSVFVNQLLTNSGPEGTINYLEECVKQIRLQTN